MRKMRESRFAFSEAQEKRAIALLKDEDADMSISDIAKRVGCAKSKIVQLNKAKGIRVYTHSRRRYTLNGHTVGDNKHV